MTLNEFDAQYRDRYKLVCGTDEAGRGPLAGDVYAAAVIFPEDVVIEGLNDSKKLTEKKREQLFDEIKEKALTWCIATASVAEIEEINILEAAKLAMKRAVAGLKGVPDIILVDGNMPPEFPVPYEAVVKGDGKSQAIAAASVLAKVARDRYMKQLAAEYPEWKFDKHKGYGTKLHYQMLDMYGESPVHRKSFLKKYYAKKAELTDEQA
ncbi:MAG: ribonuclease HII [Ruminococcus sp.]|nr:ribonuclease HII [Ruminococcus sp.]